MRVIPPSCARVYSFCETRSCRNATAKEQPFVPGVFVEETVSAYIHHTMSIAMAIEANKKSFPERAWLPVLVVWTLEALFT